MEKKRRMKLVKLHLELAKEYLKDYFVMAAYDQIGFALKFLEEGESSESMDDCDRGEAAMLYAGGSIV